MHEDTPKPERKGPGRVHIYGAGIAGLTAAQELAHRGFQVRVYEPAQEYDETGQQEGPLQDDRKFPKLAVGGIARSQFLRVAKGAPGNFPEQGQYTDSDRYRLTYAYSKDLEDGDLDFYDINTFGLRPQERFPGTIHIRIPQLAGARHTPTHEDITAAVRDYLTGVLPHSLPLAPSRVVIVGEREEQFARKLGVPFLPVEDKDSLLLEVMHFLPGEHGFRFFPSSYRHLFATMVEIPLLDEHSVPTGRRVYDNLVPSSFYGIAAQGRRIRFLRRAPATRPVEALQELSDLASSGYPPKDSLQFTLRLWRYMSTCPERRKADYEKLSWWEYLEDFDPKSGTRRYQYSPAFKKDMQFAPRVLAAFDGAWGDARTNGNTLVQLYLNNLLPLPKTDGTLNGPTTPALFRPWRRYLEEYLGVDFREGKLLRLEYKDGQLVPLMCSRPPGWPEWWQPGAPEWKKQADDPADYYLVATDAAAAEKVTRRLPEVGVIQGLRGFTTRVPPNPRGPEKEQPRTPGVLPGHEPWDRFQTLTGIQFFFPSSVRLAEGYLYFLDAPWGLSAINSQQYWTTPPTLHQDGFASVLSVDIGNWYVREPGLKSPSACSRHELAHETWRQIRRATEQHNAPLPHALGYGFMLPEPSWYHVDRFIRFRKDPVTNRERPIKNLAPYLIPILGDWDNRPGPEPWDPLAPAAPRKPKPPLPEGLWQAPHGGYYVHWGKLVFAGTYLKTFTRMTTMESANESARHAVNAIIDHYLAHPKPKAPPGQRTGAAMRTRPAVADFSVQGSLTGSPEFRMTPMGEYCRIWDPEKHELPELAPLRELDAKLFAAGLPHVWDVLRLEPRVLPLLPALDPLGGAGALKSFLEKVRQVLELMPGLPWPGLPGPSPGGTFRE